jgi:hypothetical protein
MEPRALFRIDPSRVISSRIYDKFPRERHSLLTFNILYTILPSTEGTGGSPCPKPEPERRPWRGRQGGSDEGRSDIEGERNEDNVRAAA